ncbi:hypothetical protein TrRE_jg10069 [Triparma retinervis]|uniref:Nuclear nucleic acid-binding protein C1D n=1 Tax=Triparma retinervis TaxID=2557542 RepID=A0A9W7E155_9STRA|nr:hypothetical protein TrRE_jg10069 [Triparma retinervis]
MNSTDLAPLEATLSSLGDIEKSLTPLLALQERNREKMEAMSRGPVPEEDRVDLKSVAEVNAAIALAIKTLYFVKLRLQGVPVTKEHPVRKGLNRVRQTMKRLRQMHTEVPGGENKKGVGVGEKKKRREGGEEEEERGKKEEESRTKKASKR